MGVLNDGYLFVVGVCLESEQREFFVFPLFLYLVLFFIFGVVFCQFSFFYFYSVFFIVLALVESDAFAISGYA